MCVRFLNRQTRRESICFLCCSSTGVTCPLEALRRAPASGRRRAAPHPRGGPAPAAGDGQVPRRERRGLRPLLVQLKGKGTASGGSKWIVK